METQEPFGYEGVHREKKFLVMTVDENLILDCTVKHDGKEQRVSCNQRISSRKCSLLNLYSRISYNFKH